MMATLAMVPRASVRMYVSYLRVLITLVVNVIADCRDGTYCNSPGGICSTLNDSPNCSYSTASECNSASMCHWDGSITSPCKELTCGSDGQYPRLPCSSQCGTCNGPLPTNCTCSYDSSYNVSIDLDYFTAGSGAASTSVAMLAGIAIGAAALFAIIILVALILRRNREETRKRTGQK